MTRKKILIADDNQLTLQSMQNTIPWNEWGFELIGFAENGNEAVQPVLLYETDRSSILILSFSIFICLA